MMTTWHVVIPNKEDVGDFVMRMSKLPYDVNLTTGRIVVDAKSFMGVIGIGIGKTLTVEANTEDIESLKLALQKYLV